jgi:thiol-disulfide isomerase/thioredoxin
MNRRPLAIIAVIASLTVLILAAVVQWLALSEPELRVEKREKLDKLVMKTLVWYDEPKPAPKAAFLGPDGKTMRFSDFRGKALVVNLWATWCAPCIKELPSLDKLEEERGGSTFSVIAISIDKEGLSVIQPFFETNNIKSLKSYADPGAKVKREFAPPGLPTTYLINRDGQVVAWFVGPTEWDSPDAMKSVDRLMASTRSPATASSGP